MTWILKSFEQLSTRELYEILKLRTEIFVLEQECAYLEVDGKDLSSFHLWLQNESNEIIAYCRLLPAGLSYNETSIGRVLVKDNQRGKGLAQEMLKKAILEIQKLWGKKSIRIEAQYYLKDFYASFGFVKVSEPFLEDGIKHIEMLLS